VRIAGRHTLTILLPADAAPESPAETQPAPAAPLFIRDELVEEYTLRGAPQTRFTGHTLLFVYGLSLEEQAERESVVRERALERELDVEVEETSTGTRLTVPRIGFVADQATILPDERSRLDGIADLLSGLAGVRFLVVGHTADVGLADSQLRLSRERAEVIVRELVARGLDATLFDVEGRGGTEPAATNATEEGRARNRRVEIYILEE
jgi:outer membrane protein OmpA-like peptidoglycan-associated protein